MLTLSSGLTVESVVCGYTTCVHLEATVLLDNTPVNSVHLSNFVSQYFVSGHLGISFLSLYIHYIAHNLDYQVFSLVHGINFSLYSYYLLYITAIVVRWR